MVPQLFDYATVLNCSVAVLHVVAMADMDFEFNFDESNVSLTQIAQYYADDSSKESESDVAKNDESQEKNDPQNEQDASTVQKENVAPVAAADQVIVVSDVVFPLHCHLCRRKFHTASNRNSHVVACEAIKKKTAHLPYGCSYCPKKYENERHLLMHTPGCIKHPRVSLHGNT